MKKRLFSYLGNSLAIVIGIVLILVSVMFEFIVPTDADKKPHKGKKPQKPSVNSSDNTSQNDNSDRFDDGIIDTAQKEYYGTTADTGEVYRVEGDAQIVSKVEKMTNDDIDVDPAGRVFYVDAVNGNDNNDGLSKDRPLLSLYRVNTLELKPGDRVLFKRDCVWNGELVPKNSGTAEHPIVYGMYGSGLKPMINGCGEVFATVFLCDVSYVTVRNLEITNYRTDMTDYRSGIYVMMRKSKVEGIKIQNNYVHSSMNLYATQRYNNAGFHSFGAIAFCAQTGKSWDNETINFEDIIVENNRVDRINGTGICTYSGVKNARIRSNIVSNVTGDGIILGHCFDSVVEYNIVYTSGFGGIGNPHVNIWTYNATNSVMQYNESYDCQSSVQDGQGFDIDDNCKNVTLQYNYSHDNIGGFFLGCNYFGNPYGTVVRYNISQNDKKGIFWLVCPSSTTVEYDPSKLLYDIYNNTVYTNQEIANVIKNEVYNINFEDYGKFRNNILYIEGSPDADWGESDMALEFSNNCIYGVDTSYITDEKLITANPLLLASGTGKTGRSTCGGYQLLKGSPCIATGALIENNGGLDYWGNTVSATEVPNIGAYGAGGVTRPIDMNLTAGRIPDASFHAVSRLVSQASYLAPLTDEKASTSVASKKVNKSTEQWLQFSFEEALPLRSVLLTAPINSYFFPVSYKIEVWKNGEWVKVADSTGREHPYGGETLVFNFEEVHTDKLRVTATELAGKNGNYYMEIAEIAAFSVGKN